jgi:hypothetical protein
MSTATLQRGGNLLETVRPACAERVARMLQEHGRAPVLVLVGRVLELIEDAAVRAAGRGASSALSFTYDQGRRAEICRRAREEERGRWAVGRGRG